MNIQIHFSRLYNSFPLNETKAENEACVKKAVDAYSAEGIELDKKARILFFFVSNGLSIRDPSWLGDVIAKRSPEYTSFTEGYAYEIGEIRDFASFEYIVRIAPCVGECPCEIAKVLTIAHECRHIAQDLSAENCLLKDLVLKKYLRLKSSYQNEVYRNLPTELDALRQSKRIACKIYGEKKVGTFLDERIKKHRDKLIYMRPDSNGAADEVAGLTYWEHLKAINVEENVDFVTEFDRIWKQYSPAIKAEVDEIRTKCEEDWNEKETNLVKAHEFLIKTA